MKRPNWAPLKEYEGHTIYIDPGSGKFGVEFANGQQMERKDLKIIESEIRKRRGGFPAIITRDERAWPVEITGYENDHWLTANGDKFHRWHYDVYRFDEELVLGLDALMDRKKELETALQQLSREWSELKSKYKTVREEHLPEILAEVRAQKEATTTE
jgi:hypothetical protein